MPGPKPTPTEALKARGSWRAKAGEKTSGRGLRVEPGAPPCPAWLVGDARTIWAELVPLLDGAGFLAPIDGHALACYATLFARWRAAERVLSAGGSIYLDGSGDPRSRPEVGIAATLARLLQKFERELYLTPAARSRLVTAAATPAADSEKAARAAKLEKFRLT